MVRPKLGRLQSPRVDYAIVLIRQTPSKVLKGNRRMCIFPIMTANTDLNARSKPGPQRIGTTANDKSGDELASTTEKKTWTWANSSAHLAVITDTGNFAAPDKLD